MRRILTHCEPKGNIHFETISAAHSVGFYRLDFLLVDVANPGLQYVA